jgi:hypothetical protein
MVFGASRYAAIVVLLAIPACTRPIHNKSHDILLQNSDYVRRTHFTRFMSEEDCGAVTRTFFQGMNDPTGTSFWNITCSNGKSYVVMIEADDIAKTLDCETYEASGVFRCFMTFEEIEAHLHRPETPRFPGDLPPAVLRQP